MYVLRMFLLFIYLCQWYSICKYRAEYVLSVFGLVGVNVLSTPKTSFKKIISKRKKTEKRKFQGD
jgi:hypothetical protein